MTSKMSLEILITQLTKKYIIQGIIAPNFASNQLKNKTGNNVTQGKPAENSIRNQKIGYQIITSNNYLLTLKFIDLFQHNLTQKSSIEPPSLGVIAALE